MNRQLIKKITYNLIAVVLIISFGFWVKWDQYFFIALLSSIPVMFIGNKNESNKAKIL